MSAGFAVEAGALRRRVPEPEWAGATVDLDAGLVQPLTQDLAPAGEELREAAGLVAGAGELRIEVASSAGGLGVLAQGGVAGGTGAVAVRRAATSPEPRLLPEVEVSVFPAAGVVDELLRLLPPAEGTWADHDDVRLPAEHAARWRHLTDTERGREAVLAQLGWESTPEVLEWLVADLRGTAQVTAAVGDRVARRHWLLTSRGWAEVLVDGLDVVHRPVGRAAMRAALEWDLAGLLTREVARG